MADRAFEYFYQIVLHVVELPTNSLDENGFWNHHEVIVKDAGRAMQIVRNLNPIACWTPAMVLIPPVEVGN